MLQLRNRPPEIENVPFFPSPGVSRPGASHRDRGLRRGPLARAALEKVVYFYFIGAGAGW